MENNLKLFVWRGVLVDYTSGIAFALAETEEEAREMLIRDTPCLAKDSAFALKPEMHENKACFTIWGGG